MRSMVEIVIAKAGKTTPGFTVIRPEAAERDLLRQQRALRHLRKPRLWAKLRWAKKVAATFLSWFSPGRWQKALLYRRERLEGSARERGYSMGRADAIGDIYKAAGEVNRQGYRMWSRIEAAEEAARAVVAAMDARRAAKKPETT
jgi:hypothetical protein